MRRRLFAAVAISALVAAAVSPSAAAAGSPTRFQRINVSHIDPQLLPLLADKNRQIDVMVELSDQPVAARTADAQDAGSTVSASQKSSWRTQIKSGQSGVVDKVKKAGGRVISQVQDAYNGVHAYVPASAIATLAAVPGVAGVHLVPTYKPQLVNTVPYIGAPQAWTSTGQTGEGVKIAVIDTGVDFYHADFGGSGNPADYAYGLAHDTTAPAYNADGTTVAFPSAKIPVGYDFVGDAYDASAPAGSPATIPHPDPNPLDCNSHGTHTASTAAGYGELSDGSTYHGPYNSSIYGTTDFAIGPGVAPNASLFIYRVFGCEGSTDVVTEAINRAVADGADVISMSLGSDFGTADTPDAVAAQNAARAGVVVVASSGNEGSNAYMTGTPGTSSRTISVAALDTNESFPGGTIQLASGNVTAIDANGAPLPVTGRLHVLMAGSSIALGCDAADYASVLPGDIVVTARGVCARVDRATLGQAAGAAAVIMVNNASGLPPFEGPINGVHIPFLGVDQADGPALAAADGATVTVASAGALVNPTYKHLADFTSYGPRFGDSALKPDVTAPGVSVIAAGMGTGTGILVDSGTSMAAPHVAGVAALTIEAHPGWRVNEVKAAIVSTADASSAKIVGYDPLGAGSGVVQAQRATSTKAVALTYDGLDNLSFGYAELSGALKSTRSFVIENKGSSNVTYKLAASFIGSSAGAKVSVSPSRVTVRAHGSATVKVTLSMTSSKVAALPDADTFSGLGPGAVLSVQGVVTATPTSAPSGIYQLRVPFLLVPRGTSNVVAGPLSPYHRTGDTATSATFLKNFGLHSGTADVYSWGIYAHNTSSDMATVRAVGVQTQPGEACGSVAGDACMIFAVNGWHEWSNAAANEFDIAIDTTNDGIPDYIVVGVDLGAVLTGSFNGIMASFTFDAAGNLIDAFYADAPMNSSTIELPALASDMGITSASGPIAYAITGYDLINGNIDSVPSVATYNVFNPSLSNGQFVTLASGHSSLLPVSASVSGQAATPALGWMIVSLDDRGGDDQAALLPVGHLPNH
jgi:minor extracellular serine protease Vpr